jgi:MoxR-like ATPase
MTEDRRRIGLDATSDSRETVEAALFEMKRVIAGQDQMLERVLVCLLAGGHMLIEGVPGLAKTLTIKTAAQVLGGTFQRVQFTPDLVPADLVGTRIYRPTTGTFETELGPVFTNFLLADEINRAPAKVQSALLEVMQELQVTIGNTTHKVEPPFLVMATQNPIESEGTYPLPEAQVDRFMLKVLVDYPALEDEHTVAQRALAAPVEVRRVIELERLIALQETVRNVYVDPAVARYAVRLASVTRDLDAHGLGELAPYIAFGVSPRGPISMLHAARALAVLRGRNYVLPSDVHELAPDAMRHRIVLSYRALAEGVGSEAVITPVLDKVPMPRVELVSEVA